VSDKADLETVVTRLEKTLKNLTMEREDLAAQLDAEKVCPFDQLLLALLCTTLSGYWLQWHVQ